MLDEARSISYGKGMVMGLMLSNIKKQRQSLVAVLLGGRSDSNRRPTEPQSGTLTN